MITPGELQNGAALPDDLTNRQREVADLVARYVAVAHEMPSAGWLSRRMSISRERARQHLEAIRDKGWLTRREREK